MRPTPGVYTFHLSGRYRARWRGALDREAERRPLDARGLNRLRAGGQARQLVPQRRQLTDALLDGHGLRPRHRAHMTAGHCPSLAQSDNTGDVRQREPKRLRPPDEGEAGGVPFCVEAIAGVRTGGGRQDRGCKGSSKNNLDMRY